jgi:hypothetical protein
VIKNKYLVNMAIMIYVKNKTTAAKTKKMFHSTGLAFVKYEFSKCFTDNYDSKFNLGQNPKCKNFSHLYFRKLKAAHS